MKGTIEVFLGCVLINAPVLDILEEHDLGVVKKLRKESLSETLAVL